MASSCLLNCLLSEAKEHEVPKAAALSMYNVMLQLLEVEKLHDIEWAFDSELKRFWITARETLASEKDIILPLIHYETITLKLLRKLQERFGKKYIIAVIDSDTTCVYYGVQDGIVEPSNQNIKSKRYTAICQSSLKS